MRANLGMCLWPRTYTAVSAGCLVWWAVCQGGALDGVGSHSGGFRNYEKKKWVSWDTLVSPVSIPGCPTSEPSFFFLLVYADNNE